MKIKTSFFLFLSCLGMAGCLEKDLENSCIQGRYVGTYCEGMVLEILGDSDIAMDWEGMFDSKIYTNSIVASVDTIYLSTLNNRREIEKLITEGNVFYFQFNLGGYPRKEYNICEPSSFVTIFNISKDPCYVNRDK